MMQHSERFQRVYPKLKKYKTHALTYFNVVRTKFCIDFADNVLTNSLAVGSNVQGAWLYFKR